MKRNELVFIPMAGKSHLAPAVEFAYQLLKKDERFSVTFLLISSVLEQTPTPPPTISHPHIHFIPVPKPLEIPSPELMKKSFTNYLLLYIKSHASLIKDIIANRFSASSSNRLSGLVVDMFCTDIIDVAVELGVPSYLFFTCGAATLGLMLYLTSHGKLDGTEPNSEHHHISTYLNPVPKNVLPDFAFDKQDRFGSQGDQLKKTKGIIINTVLELESHAISSLLDGVNPPVYTLGPLLDVKGKINNRQSSDHDEILQWLDNQPPKSVVFLCFGNYGSFNTTQLKEIATGLERSGQRFLWSVRKRHQDNLGSTTDFENFDEALPEGFLRRTKEVGRICGWAPQVEVLRHPATGGFVSHCGWNSVLESFWFGVPIVTWPMYAEQQMNAFQLARDLELGVELTLDFKWGDEDTVVSSEEIERALQCLMDGGEGGLVRKRVEEMSEKFRDAVLEGGSSYESFGCFIEDVLTNIDSDKNHLSLQ